MEAEAGFLNALRISPHDDVTRAAYADWLEEKGDPRTEFLRLQLVVKSLPVEANRETVRQRLRVLRTRLSFDWLSVVEPIALLGELTTRAQRVVRKAKLTTLGDLCELGDYEVLSLGPGGGFAEAPLRELRDKLAALGLRFRQSEWEVQARDARKEAAKFGIVLDYSASSVVELEELIKSAERMARVAADLDDSAWVGDDVLGILDLGKLGAYYGELFVHYAGAEWTEVEGEDGPESAVVRNGVIVLPLSKVCLRVTDGHSLTQYFQSMRLAMSGQMNEVDFWEIIQTGGPYPLDAQDAHLESVRNRLLTLKPQQVQAFYALFCQRMIDAQSWELWGAAYLINGGCSDDGFVYFRAWLIAQGPTVYATAVANPDSLVGAIETQRNDHEFELLYALPLEVYEELAGEEMPDILIDWPQKPRGEEWDFDDDAAMTRRLPRLATLLLS